MQAQKPLDSAETLALKALAFLANSPDDLDRFMALSGLSQPELRQRAEDPEFLGAVLDFLLANEPLLIGFCESESLEPRIVFRARYALGGA